MTDHEGYTRGQIEQVRKAVWRMYHAEQPGYQDLRTVRELVGLLDVYRLAPERLPLRVRERIEGFCSALIRSP